MKLRELLTILQQTTDKIGSSTPFIVGGTVRDKYIGKLDNIADLDITTGDKTVSYLASEFAAALRKKYNVTEKTADDGHITVFIGNLKVDFSSNFTVSNIDQLLKTKNINNPDDMLRELYSRDFTCNAMLMTLDLKQILDPLHQSFADIKSKKIKTCLSPEITLTSNRNRVVRAIYLAAKLNFDIDSSIIEFVKKNPQSIQIGSEKTLNDKLIEAFKYNPEKSSKLLTEMGLWNYVPISESLHPYYLKFTRGNINVL